MADESGIIAEWLYATLHGASAIVALVGTRIFDSEVTQNLLPNETVIYPCIVFSQQAPQDVNTANGMRVLVRPLWLVKVIVDSDSATPGTWKNAAAIFSVIDSVLYRASGSASAGSVYACVRENDQIRYTEPKPGSGYFRHRGALFRIEARATSTP